MKKEREKKDFEVSVTEGDLLVKKGKWSLPVPVAHLHAPALETE